MKIKSLTELREYIQYESEQYNRYMFASRARRIMAWLKEEPAYEIMNWQIKSRKADYYHYRVKSGEGSLIDKLRYLYFTKRKNHLAKCLGIEIGTENIGKGLLLYHYSGGCVINGGAIIGANCHLHGNNCIGNGGGKMLDCPIIGDSVMLGVGAKVIGNVRVADHVKIAAGAVVVKDILEEGCTVAGFPAHIVKSPKYE